MLDIIARVALFPILATQGLYDCRKALDFEPNKALMNKDGHHPGPGIYAEWGRKVYGALRADVCKFSRDNGEGNRADHC